MFPLDWIADVVAQRSEDPKLVIHVYIVTFELVQPMPTVTQRYRQTDGRTDGRKDGRLTIAIPRFTLHASRVKKNRLAVSTLLI